MTIFEQLDYYGHEQLIFGRDEKTGMKCIISIHNTALGPATGGTRFWNYATEEDALYDVLRLSRGMSLKNAAAGLALGGGKAVIIGDPEKLKSEEFFQAYGRIVDSLGGKYYTAEDVNINEDDIAKIKSATPYVTGTKEISGNPSPFTAKGVYKGMKAGASVKFGTDSLNGLVVAVQGLGSVGYRLCEMLHAEGAVLKVFDINQNAVDKAVAKLGAQAVGAKEILMTGCDIFAPCALGAVLDVNNAKLLQCKMICGAANNVLADAETCDVLESMDVLYLPDYIVNAGGVINCGEEITQKTYDAAVVDAKVDRIYDTVLEIVKLAKEKDISTYLAADEYAYGIIRAAAKR